MQKIYTKVSKNLFQYQNLRSINLNQKFLSQRFRKSKIFKNKTQDYIKKEKGTKSIQMVINITNKIKKEMEIIIIKLTKTINKKQRVAQKELQKTIKDKDEQINSLKQEIKNLRMDILKEFKFSSVENFKQNLEVFDQELRKKRQYEEEKMKELIIESIDANGIQNIFAPQESVKTSQSKQQISQEAQNYLDILAQRFDK